ncbi:hypothetical protein PFL603g_03007 [Pseudomonas fluorescens]|uniref:Uncharacterized protein n=1 Tax=Pseudomonas fluorescens TaxID=294 RepID=A0A109KRJ5_PSEFL|nr:hypothetical protein PFL603g_03007 [Pseudomonas fluorescens]
MVVELVGFAGFVFDLGEQQPGVVVAVLDLGAVGVETAAYQVQAVCVFVAGDVAEFVAFGDDFAVGVVAEFACGAAWQDEANQPTDAVPFIGCLRAVFILTGNLSTKIIIAIALDPTIGQLLLKQLPALVPHQPMTADVGVPNPGQLPLFVVAVVSRVTIRVSLADDIALVITLILPDRLPTPDNSYKTVVMLVGRRLIIPWKQRHQASGIVVLIGRHRAHRVLLDGQAALVVVGFKMRGAIRINPLHQPRPLVMDIHLLATIGVMHGDTPVIAPGITRVHLRKACPMPDATRRLASALPFPEEARPTGQLAFQNDVLIVVPITLAFPDSIGRANQSSVFVIGVGNEVLLGLPHVGLSPFGTMHLVVHRNDAIQLITQQQRTASTVIQPLNPP